MECFYSDCRKCVERNSDYEPIKIYKKNGTIKVMFIGQDPTIRKNQYRVKIALMLDIENGQISRWLKEIFGQDNLNNFEILGTNLVKCVLQKVATNDGVGGIDYLQGPFNNCQTYLKEEFIEFKPEYVFTLGEPCHQLFYSMINNLEKPKKEKMSNYFDGLLHNEIYEGHTFKYSPLLHIQTYRVAKKYGDIVKAFEKTIQNIKK